MGEDASVLDRKDKGGTPFVGVEGDVALDTEGGGGYFSEFTVVSSVCELGMLCVELEAIDE